LRASGADAGVSCVHVYWVDVTWADGEGVAVGVARGVSVCVADGDVEPHAALTKTASEPPIHQ
jgi:hypothetical protein